MPEGKTTKTTIQPSSSTSVREVSCSATPSTQRRHCLRRRQAKSTFSCRAAITSDRLRRPTSENQKPHVDTAYSPRGIRKSRAVEKRVHARSRIQAAAHDRSDERLENN